MAKKYELITELYERTRQGVTEPAQWQRFLNTACRNYRLSFDEQLLLFAQRPDATAVLEIEKWNRQFGRWVNRGATGIAVFNTDTASRTRLKYYFDISDTHETEFAKPVPMWEYNAGYESEVIATLEDNFGELSKKDDIPVTFMPKETGTSVYVLGINSVDEDALIKAKGNMDEAVVILVGQVN